MKNMLRNEYRHNKKFRDCVDEYCAEKHISVEQALRHEFVHQMFLMYTEV